ncbi:SMP-30/gluconolactonase/LRE family protein [Tenggerimyces flavus]|uniref:SMP-30/gluconolactonase/LRE family protein n=1 Tax=Tenggerimyces flavus TaxID=1708749 RepID=A0ABV7YML1_9ACTN|nr:SMP-30/gluconolactonase/LRE family protein [Tenggerimyces flavus]MBM7789606.1 sugar lactone lactonase YvrE [Tenggerimyces flavus]
MAAVEQVTSPISFHGEGPVWHEDWGGLRLVDMLAGDVLTVDLPSGSVARLHLDDIAAAIRPRVSGGMVVAVERGFVLVGKDGSIERLEQLWTSKLVRMNDGGTDPDGRFYCGSMAYDTTPGAGALYRLDADRSTSVVFEGVTISNGLAWSPDGSLAYYIDTPTRRVDVFDYEPDVGLVVESRRMVVEIPAGEGGPDGMTIDGEGYLWVALFGGSAVRRYSPAGQLDGVVELPVSNITACTFGGANLDELYITTSRDGLAETDQPEAGSIFRASTGVRGLEALPFAG